MASSRSSHGSNDALDTDGDGQADHHLSREWMIALDPSSGAVSWQRTLARILFTDPNRVPGFVVCPTPAAFATMAGTPLLVAASSLVGTVSILDATTGADDGDLTVAGRALASPVMANGRLITVAENGTVEAQLSSVNHPPTAPVLAANPRPLDAADVTLHWSPAMDLDGEQPTYELRIDSDGELLESYAQQIFPGQGVTSLAVTAPLTPGGQNYVRGAGAGSARGPVRLVGAGDVHRGDGRDRDRQRDAGGKSAERGGCGAVRRSDRCRGRNVSTVGHPARGGGRQRARRGRRPDDDRRDRAVGRA